MLHFSEAALFAQELTRLKDPDLAKSYLQSAVDKLNVSGTEEDVTFAAVLLDEKMILPTEIKDAIERVRKRTNVVPTLLDVLLRSKDGAHQHYKQTLESASSDDYAQALREAPHHSLLQLIKLYVSFITKQDDDTEFPPFSTSVKKALSQILNDWSNARMVDIVSLTLTDLGVDTATLGSDVELGLSEEQEAD